MKRARASRIPEPFMVTPAMWEWAAGEGMGKEWVTRETVVFVDYWRGRSGQIAVKADWPATWRNWLRKAQTDAPHGRMHASPARGRAESPDERVQRLMALADRMEAGDGEQRALDA